MTSVAINPFVSDQLKLRAIRRRRIVDPLRAEEVVVCSGNSLYQRKSSHQAFRTSNQLIDMFNFVVATFRKDELIDIERIEESIARYIESGNACRFSKPVVKIKLLHHHQYGIMLKWSISVTISRNRDMGESVISNAFLEDCIRKALAGFSIGKWFICR